MRDRPDGRQVHRHDRPASAARPARRPASEWNDLGPVATEQTGTYQTLPTLHAEYWNLIRFNERDVDGGIAWLMRKDQCMHCEDPGCLAACPAPGAIVQYANGIVDVNPDQCIGCGYCETGCPFDVPRFHRRPARWPSARSASTASRSASSRPASRPARRVPPVRHEGRHGRAGQARVDQ
jgi:ferredoxin